MPVKPAGTRASPKLGRWSGVLLISFAGVLVFGFGGALVSAWFARNTLGARLAVRYLASHRIPAIVKLTRLDAGGVEGSFVLGRSDRPTLVAPHFTAEFAPAPLFSVPSLRRVALDHPRLELRYDGRRLDFGALQPLIDAAARTTKRGGPGPDIVVSNGEVRLQTPYGRVTAGISADLIAGALRTADIQLEPADLKMPNGATATGLTGKVLIREGDVGRYRLQGRLSAENATLQRTASRGPQVVFRAELPFRQDAAEPFAGPIRASLQGSSAAILGPGVLGSRGSVTASIAGDLSGTKSSPAFHGQASAKAQVDQLSLGATRLGSVNLDAQADGLDLGSDRRFGARFSLNGHARTGQTRFRTEAVALSAMQVAASGRVRSDRAGPAVTAKVSFVATGGLGRARASALANRLAPGPYGADLRPALEQALIHTTVSAPGLGLTGARNAWALHLDQPLQARSDGGARLVLAGFGGRWASTGSALTGDGVLTLSGGGFPDAKLTVAGGSLSSQHLDAKISADVSGSAGPLRGARLSVAGRLTGDAGAVRFTLARCTALAFETLAGLDSKPLATAASVDVCPTEAGPLLVAWGSTWRAAARVQHLMVEAPGAEIAIDDGDADLRFFGRGPGVAGQASIARVRLRDTAKSVRFRPLQVSGPVTLAGQQLTGTLDIALSQPMRSLGRVQVAEDFRSSVGTLTLNTPQLAFSPDGLQPAAILPGLAGLGQDVSGPASATVSLSWRGSALTTRVRVRLDGVQLKTAAGLVSGVRTDLLLTGLDPLTSAPAQRLTADRIAAVLPLTTLSATYALGGDALELAGARASLAGGQVSLAPMRVALTPGAALSGVVHVDGVELGTVLDVLNLSRAVTIQAKIAGALPFRFRPQGLRITDGRLAAMGPGRLTVRREALTGVASGPDTGAPSTSAVQDFAYQALEDLAFTELDASVASRPQGRLGVVFHIRGRHDPAVAQEARVGLIDLLRGHAFDRPVPLPKGTDVNLTLDTSLNLDDLLGAYLGRSAPVQP